jgi:hypothetical protein
MTLKQIYEIGAERLRAELRALGMDARGARSELINNLHQAGVYEINDSLPPRPSKYIRTIDFPNHESVLLGYGASIESASDQKLVICNTPKSTPLIEGDFSTHKICINDTLLLKESQVNANIKGQEGELRRQGSQLYMYRSSDVHEGWYALQFGAVEII